MDIQELKVIKDKLSLSIKELQRSIDAARDRIAETYGETSEFITRLDSYYPAIQKQFELVAELDIHIERHDMSSIQDVSVMINAISEMIKNDARSLLYMLNTGKDLIPEDTILH